MRNKFLLTSLTLLIFWGCAQNNNVVDNEKLKNEVWQTVLAHNKAWTVDENIDEQMNYVHENIVSVSPPFIDKISGIEKYREGYLDWYKQASVHSFKEVNPHITLYNEKFAVVVYNIEMSFDYDNNLVDGWKGMDTMTLVNVGGKWLITSDMFGKAPDTEES